jgi:hypothetical protein
MRDLDITNPYPASSKEHLAYQRAYDFASAYPFEDDKAMCGRVIGFMLKELPWDEGRSKLATEIISCTNEQALADLGTFYVNHFLRACETLKLAAVIYLILTLP